MSKTKYFDAVRVFNSWFRAGLVEKYAGFMALNYDLLIDNHGKEISESLFDETLGVALIGEQHYKILFKNKETFFGEVENDYSESKLHNTIDKLLGTGLVESSLNRLYVPGSNISVFVVGYVILFTKEVGINSEFHKCLGYVAIDRLTNEVDAVPLRTTLARDWDVCLNALNYDSVYSFVEQHTSDREVIVS